MDAEEFFARWSRRNAQARPQPENRADGETASERETDDAHPLPPPTIEDVAALTPQSDFSRFVARGVDEQVRRSALKKLFADPHFNVMDGLDVYIDDYSKFTPIPAAVLAALNHAQNLLNPQALLDRLPEHAAKEGADDGDIAATDADTDESVADRGDDDSPPSPATPPDRPDHGDPIQDM